MPENCTHDCSTCGESCSERDLRVPANALSSIKKVIAVVSGKGGVGKSTVTSSLAVAMARRGRKVAVLDADITGPSIPMAFGVHQRATGTDAGIDPAVTPLRHQAHVPEPAHRQRDRPRGLAWPGHRQRGQAVLVRRGVGRGGLYVRGHAPWNGGRALTVFQSLPVDGIIVVTSPQDLVSMIVSKAVHMAEMMSIPVLGLIENYSWYQCPDCGARHAIFGESRLEEVARELGLPILARLPIDPALAAACDAGKVEGRSAITWRKWPPSWTADPCPARPQGAAA